MPDDDKPQGGDSKADALQKLLDKNNGDAQRTLGILFSENFDLREKNRKLKEQVPAEGSRVLTKEEGAEYDASKVVTQILSDLEVKPEELKGKIEGAAAENAKLKRESERNALVGLGYSRDALADFDALEGASIESYFVKDEKKDGKGVKVPYVKVEGKERPLDEYAAEKRPAQAKILRESGQAAGGKSYVNQDAGGKAPSSNEYDEIRSQMESTKKTAQPKDATSVLAALGGH